MGLSFILASASPRRRELLALLGLPLKVQVAGVVETPQAGETPLIYVKRVAREKAEAVAREVALTPSPSPAGRGELVIAADTEVVLDGEILGKPRDAAEATKMLTRLRGRTHEVISAIAILDLGRLQGGATAIVEAGDALWNAPAHEEQPAARGSSLHEDVCRSPAPMRNYSAGEIADYVASGDPLDKAGAYAIQHAGFHPVENFSHCYAGVMGLPLCHLTRTLRQLGVEPPANVPMACRQFTQYRCPVYQKILSNEEGQN